MIDSSAPKNVPYSWGDLADSFSRASTTNLFPNSLVKIEIYWDQITILTDSPTQEGIRTWLETLFPMRISEDSIRLDGPSFSRSLPFVVSEYDSEVDGPPPAALATQFVAASSQIWFRKTKVDDHLANDSIPTFAFHSVKGGVGRTTSAISFAMHLANAMKRKPLLVDADFEAPGISYLFLNDGRECHFSLEDLLVLAHADENGDASETINFGAQKLANQVHDGITFLPCLRRADMLSAFAIRPEQLQKSHSDRPFFLLRTLQKIAAQAGCDCLIVDLRAGFTDLAAMVLCAPGVASVFVTTPSGQAILSTREMLNFIGNATQANDEVSSYPAVVINNVIPQVRRSSDFARLTNELKESANSFIHDTENGASAGDIISLSTDEVTGPPIVALDHAPSLTAAPSALRDFIDDLRGQTCFDQLSTGLDQWARDHIEAGSQPPSIFDTIGQSSNAPKNTGNELRAKRSALYDFASHRIYAETTDDPSKEFLAVRALRELKERFQTELPNATCIGMKGAGKTFTFNLLARMGSWQHFLDSIKTIAPAVSGRSARILPVLPARNLQNSQEISAIRHAMANNISDGNPIEFSQLNSLIDDAAQNLSSDSDWGKFWLDVLAWSCGIEVAQQSAGDQLLARLAQTKTRVVALFDGLEESFQSFHRSANHQAAIRGLTSSLAQRLLEIPDRPLGQINFVRSDLVFAAYPNNSRQFADRNRAFALTWYDKDILELAAWLAAQSGAANTWDIHFQDQDSADIEDRLISLWGRKLGKADGLAKGGRTREARSAEWVIAALSDLKGRMTARDLVGFIANSAKTSISDTNPLFFDRLLVPRAMTSAIAPVGYEKMSAMAEETPELRPVIDALRKAPQFAVPLSLSEFSSKIPEMNAERLAMLEENGIILVEGNTIEMPEIFRTGLGNVVRSTGGRKSIIGLMNKARQLRSSDLTP